MNSIETQLIGNLKSYLKYNQFRINRLLELVPPKKTPLYHVLPFLLHVNINDFPGYVPDNDTPCGVERFSFEGELSASLKKLFPKHPLLSRPLRQINVENCFIKSLLLMGSLGSVGQTAKSDFDFWVCINEDQMGPNQLELLKEKLHLIENWAKDEYELEVHFFTVDIKKVQKNNFGDSDKESVGSAQARLLKEEFYRTSILVVGKIPFWWLTPTGISDEQYVQYKEAAKQSPELSSSWFIDLGNLIEISTEEFFGAALWQMNKAMDSPYKSVLKMAMLQGFLDPEEKTQLLCNVIKTKIHENLPDESNGKTLDPYSVMFDHILDSYKRKKKEDVLDLLATCFYIKSGLKTITRQRKNLNFKEKIVSQYVKSWGWNQNKMNELNDYKEWDFERVLELGNKVHSFLIETYRNLTDRLKTESKVKNLISDQDITVLGRKLFSFYSQKPGKIQLMKRAFDEGLWQDNVTFTADYNKQRNIVWTIYRGQLNKISLLAPGTSKKILKQSQNIVKTVVWAIFNQMIDKKTSMYLIPNPSPVSMAGIQELVNTTLETFPKVKISSLKNNDLLSDSTKTKMLIVLNFDSPVWMREIEKVSIIYLTSWGELFCETYSGKEGTAKVTKYLTENFSDNISNLKKFYHIFIPQSNYSKRLSSGFSAEVFKSLRR